MTIIASMEHDINMKLQNGAIESDVLSEHERMLGLIWQDLLDVAVTDQNATFLSLGGNSLLAVQMTLRIREQFGVRIPLKIIFESPTLASLSHAVVQAQIAMLSPEEIVAMQTELGTLSADELQNLLQDD